jgi:hypothetical protein
MFFLFYGKTRSKNDTMLAFEILFVMWFSELSLLLKKRFKLKIDNKGCYYYYYYYYYY